MKGNEQDKIKKPFVIALPMELSNGNNVVGYDEIPKIGGSLATTPQAAVLKYLHRVFCDKANLIADILKQTKNGLESFAFELPEVVGLTKDLSFEEQRRFSEYELARALRDVYRSKPFFYLGRAIEIFEEFDKIGL